MATLNLQFTDGAIARIGRKPEALIPILQELQVADETDILIAKAILVEILEK